MSDDEQQSYQESLDRVSSCHPPSSASLMLAGAYVTPMPPQVRPSNSSMRQSATAGQSGTSEVNECSSSSSRQSDLAEESGTSEVKEQRTNRRDGARGSSRGLATEQQSGIASSSQQIDTQGREAGQTNASYESGEASAPEPLSKHAKKKARKNKRKKAPQSTVGNAH